MTSRRYVAISRPHQLSPGRFQADLYFPASAPNRARQQHAVAVELARIYDVDATTPCLGPDGCVAQAPVTGRVDYRHLKVQGKPRSLARYLAALRRVLAIVERLATRAARAFGSWRRSLLTVLSGQLDDETPSTLRARAAGFRAEVLRTLVGYLARGPQQIPRRDPSRPLWEEAEAVAYEVWQHAGGIDPWAVTADEIDAEHQQMLYTDLSVVEQLEEANVPTAQFTVPETVAELLERSGPAEQAPIEDVVHQQLVTTAHGPAGASGWVPASTAAGRDPEAPTPPSAAGAAARRAVGLAGVGSR
ncbi:hypothetical protein [Streptomyces longwoodensis]|uniref:hypothetical protein n=1 Tax=Streptomyces longwoodensis TaxID=68231 RepID=UPI0036F01FA7